MKTTEYFRNKTTELKDELKESIKEFLNYKLKSGQSFFNVDESNRIYFEDCDSGIEREGTISRIDVYDFNIVIFPLEFDLEPIDLGVVEDIHSLMLLHYIAVHDITK